jgi:hypothetical protein
LEHLPGDRFFDEFIMMLTGPAGIDPGVNRSRFKIFVAQELFDREKVSRIRIKLFFAPRCRN